MIGNEILIAVLNQQLADKLSIINKEILSPDVLKNEENGEISQLTLPDVNEEIQHAEWLLESIIAFEDPRIDYKLKSSRIGFGDMEQVLPFQAKLFEESNDTSIAINSAREQIGEKREEFDQSFLLTDDN
jgi:bacterioferritin (cytochrome b1)